MKRAHEPSANQNAAKRVLTEWSAFAEHIDHALRKSNQLDAVNMRLGRIVEKVTAYDVNACKEMLSRMKDFKTRLEARRCDAEGFTVVNCITNESCTYPYNFNLTVGQLKDAFALTGHAFSVDMRKSYVVPLAFDFDCKDCKLNRCAADFSAALANQLQDEICDKLQVKFTQVDLAADCSIFKSQESCGLHVYFGFSVSIVLYNELIDLLSSDLPPEYTEKYKIDRVTALGLPFSSKSDARPYRPITNAARCEKLTVSSSVPFYDVTAHVIKRQEYSVYKQIGHFEHAAAGANEWDDAATLKKHLAVKLNYEIKSCDRVDWQIESLKNTNAKFVAETNYNLEWYLNEKKYDVTKYSRNTTELDSDMGEDDRPTAVARREIKQLSKKIAKFTYNIKDVVDEDLYNYLVSFLVSNECGYTFYAVAAVCSYAADIVADQTDADRLTAKLAVINFINKIVNKLDSFQEKKMLVHVLRTFEAYDALANARVDRPSEWFAEISKQIRLKEYKGDVMQMFTSTLVDLEDEAAVVDVLVNYFKSSSNLFKLADEKKIYFYYINGIYVECKEKELLGKTILMSQETYANGKTLMEKLIAIARVKINRDQARAMLSSAWLKYLCTAKTGKVKFNMYDYYICTERGVFNTLTGTYMENIPLLYFKTRKAYCLTVEAWTNSLLCDNLALVQKGRICKHYVTKIIENQNSLFYLAVVVPGLLILDETLYSEADGVEMINVYYKKVICDDANAASLYYMMPVILHYAFDLDSVMRVCALFKETVERKGKPEIREMRNVYEKILNSDATKLDARKSGEFNFDAVGCDAASFTSEMRRVYGKAFSEKLFVICYAMCAVDRDFLRKDLGVKMAAGGKRLPPEYAAGSPADSFVLDPFEVDHYRSASELNFKRAFNILFDGDVSTSDTMIGLLSSYSTIFGFDRQTLDDFFTFTSMIYYPANLRKFLTLLIGSPKCGKTTVQTLLLHSNEPSTFSTNTVFGASGSSGASPDLIQIFSTYLTNIIEVKRIDTETLKTLTGGDHVNKRGCHQNEFKDLQPLSFAIGAANELPAMTNADEAIRERLAIFMMNNKHVDVSELADYEDNPLLLYAAHLTVVNRNMNVAESAKEFSNLLYCQYAAKRNAHGLVIPKMTNATSKQATQDFLIKNNFVYDIMSKAGIVFDKDLQTTLADMKELVADQIVRYNEEHVSVRTKLTWETFKRKVLVLFANYALSDGVTFRGFGCRNACAVPEIAGNPDRALEPSPGGTVRPIELARYLRNCQLSAEKVKSKLEEYKQTHGFDAKLKLFTDVVLAEWENNF